MSIKDEMVPMLEAELVKRTRELRELTALREQYGDAFDSTEHKLRKRIAELELTVKEMFTKLSEANREVNRQQERIAQLEQALSVQTEALGIANGKLLKFIESADSPKGPA